MIARPDGWSAYAGASGVNHDAGIVGPMAVHNVLPWPHRVFSNLKAWGRPASTKACAAKHLHAYLDEFVFRFKRRRTQNAAFRALLTIAVASRPVCGRNALDTAALRGERPSQWTRYTSLQKTALRKYLGNRRWLPLR